MLLLLMLLDLYQPVQETMQNGTEVELTSSQLCNLLPYEATGHEKNTNKEGAK